MKRRIALTSGMLAAISFTVAIWSLALAQQKPAGGKLALLVGVKAYDHPELRRLEFPENDVGELAGVLTSQGFKVTLMTTDRGRTDPDLKPTAANIRAQLQRLLKNATKDDLIIVGLSGHGIQPLDSKDSFSVPPTPSPSWTRES